MAKRASKKAKATNSGATVGYEAQLWQMADALRGSMDAAEFKFSHWQGADTIRQNSLFKDSFQLAEHPTPKQKFLYVLDLPLQMQFPRGRRRWTA